MGTILLIVLVLFVIGAWPTWPHSRNWGYYRAAGWASSSSSSLFCCLWDESKMKNRIHPYTGFHGHTGVTVYHSTRIFSVVSEPIGERSHRDILATSSE